MLDVVLLVTFLLHCFVPLLSANNQSAIVCSNQTFCQSQWGQHSVCSQGDCSCEDFYYLQNSTQLSCEECPGIGESCLVSQCCNQNYLVCHRNVCMCIYSDYCWNISEPERERFQHVAQFILAITLILTATILFILFWKACTRRTVIRRNLRNMSNDSFLSLNSIQRLVLMQLQDRPPPYNAECMQPWKNANEISEPPPSYIEAAGAARFATYEISQGEDNFTLPSHLIVLTNSELHI